MNAMLNDFKVNPKFDYARLSKEVNHPHYPRELALIEQELMNDPNLRFISAPTPFTEKLHRAWLGFKGDKGKVSYYWDVLKGGGSLHQADEGCAEFNQANYFKITPDVKNIWGLLDKSLPFIEATFNLSAMKFQVEYYKYSLDKRSPYKTNIDFIACKDNMGNYYGDFTNSFTKTNLVPKMVELLMLAGNVADGLIVYNFVLGVGYFYDGRNEKLLKMCEDLYHKIMLLRDKQEWDNKI